LEEEGDSNKCQLIKISKSQNIHWSKCPIRQKCSKHSILQ
jgi:hypothetical protein